MSRKWRLLYSLREFFKRNVSTIAWIIIVFGIISVVAGGVHAYLKKDLQEPYTYRDLAIYDIYQSNHTAEGYITLYANLTSNRGVFAAGMPMELELSVSFVFSNESLDQKKEFIFWYEDLNNPNNVAYKPMEKGGGFVNFTYYPGNKVNVKETIKFPAAGDYSHVLQDRNYTIARFEGEGDIYSIAGRNVAHQIENNILQQESNKRIEVLTLLLVGFSLIMIGLNILRFTLTVEGSRIRNFEKDKDANSDIPKGATSPPLLMGEKKSLKESEERYNISLANWLVFLEGRANSNMRLVTDVASLLVSAMLISYIIASTDAERFRTISMVIVLVAFFVMYFSFRRSIGVPREEAIKARRIANMIICGKLRTPEEAIGEWINALEEVEEKERRKGKKRAI